MGNANVHSRDAKGDHHPSTDATQIHGPNNPHGPNALHHQDDVSSPLTTPEGYGESMLQSPPDSPSSVSRSPLMFTPQIPTVPIARDNEFTLGADHSNMYGHRDYADNMTQERGVPTMIVWSYGGMNVSVEGSWDNWATRQPMHKVGKDFNLVIILPCGVYPYKIIVDKDWHYSEEALSAVHNVLDVQDYVPDNLDSLAGFEPQGSPMSSYDDAVLSPEDFTNEPPALSAHLHLTLLNVPSGDETLGVVHRPQHVSLNHLYVEKARNLESVLALGLTHRFRSKYVTVALYKPINK